MGVSGMSALTGCPIGSPEAPARAPTLNRMCRPVRYLAAALLISGCTTVDVSRMGELSLPELAEAFRPCVGPYGVDSGLAQFALRQGPGSTRLEQVQLSSSGIVSDGFNHELLFDRGEGVAYVLETGGLAGVHNWYGPINTRTRCAKGALRGQ